MAEGWLARRIGEFARRKKEINTAGVDLPPLSVTKSRGVILQSEKYNKRVATDPRKYVVVQDGDFAFDPMSLYYGSLGRVKGIGRGLISPDYVSFTVDGSVEPEFMEYLLRSSMMVQKYESVAEAGNQFGKRRRVYWSVLEQQVVRVPPLPEQRRIAAILSSVDDAIEAAQAVINQLQVVKKALLAELLTRGLPGRHAKFKTMDIAEWRLGRVSPRLGEIPKDWELVRLTEHARLESGHTPSRKHPEYWDGNVGWVSLHDTDALDGPIIHDTSQHIGALGLANSSARLLPAGTVVFSRTATVGKSTILGREMTTSQDFANYVCGPRILNRYLMHLFRFMEPEWNRLKAGSTHKTVYMPVFEQLQVLLPSVDEQREISDIVDSFDERVAKEHAAVHELRHLKSALQTPLLTGELRVSAGAKGEAA